MATFATACGPGGERADASAGEPPEEIGAEAADEMEPEGGIDSPPWQAAIRRGVDFRALGQEPGWSLDIDRDGRIVYAGDYGTDTLAASTPEPTDSGDAMSWTVRTDGRELSARVREQDCRDTMSGERFTHAVTLDVDGRELHGCGRWLDP